MLINMSCCSWNPTLKTMTGAHFKITVVKANSNVTKRCICKMKTETPGFDPALSEPKTFWILVLLREKWWLDCPLIHATEAEISSQPICSRGPSMQHSCLRLALGTLMSFEGAGVLVSVCKSRWSFQVPTATRLAATGEDAIPSARTNYQAKPWRGKG